MANARSLLSGVGAIPGTTGRAIDLGCGPGFYALVLADLGFSVLAVDSSVALLNELKVRTQGRAISAVESDMLSALRAQQQPYDLCLCIGDTIAHCQSRADVEALIREAHRVLVQGGLFIVSLRNYEQELTGTERFIPVRSDNDCIAMCALDYSAEHVYVSDILWEHGGSGWAMTASSYRKLRLPVQWLCDRMQEVGFILEDKDGVTGKNTGMVVLIGRAEKQEEHSKEHRD